MNLIIRHTEKIIYNRRGEEVKPSPIELFLSRTLTYLADRFTETERITEVIVLPLPCRYMAEDLIEATVLAKGWNGSNVYAAII